MTSGPSTDEYSVREVPFDEWADVDTLVHRAAVTSGDFDYVLRPLCPSCGNLIALEYDQFEEGASQLSELVCDTCKVVWQLAPEDEGT